MGGLSKAPNAVCGFLWPFSGLSSLAPSVILSGPAVQRGSGRSDFPWFSPSKGSFSDSDPSGCSRAEDRGFSQPPPLLLLVSYYLSVVVKARGKLPEITVGCGKS